MRAAPMTHESLRGRQRNLRLSRSQLSTEIVDNNVLVEHTIKENQRFMNVLSERSKKAHQGC